MNPRPLRRSDIEALLQKWNRAACFDRLCPELLHEKLGYPQIGQTRNLSVDLGAGVVKLLKIKFLLDGTIGKAMPTSLEQ